MELPDDRTLLTGIAGGVVLIVIGLAAYVVTDFASTTALIPAVFGVMIAVLAFQATRTDRRRRSVIGVGLLGLLVALGSVRGIPDAIDVLVGTDVDTPVAAVAQGLSVIVGLAIAIVVALEVLRGD